MTWNHRVVRYKDGCVGIHEIYYDDNDKPEMCTESTVGVYGDSVDEMRETLQRMLKALDKPILDYDQF